LEIKTKDIFFGKWFTSQPTFGANEHISEKEVVGK